MKIILATKNEKKISELKDVLKELDVEILTLDSFPHIDLPPETGTTFMENALIKARAIAEATGLAALADDSGLVVDALGGAPGVYSARYAGEGATDEENYEKLLLELKRVDEWERGARFVCVLAYVAPTGGDAEAEESTFEARCEGAVARSRRGQNGFGYDPVFIPAFINDGGDRNSGTTMAELSGEEKNLISHRAKALKKFSAWAASHLAEKV